MSYQSAWNYFSKDYQLPPKSLSKALCFFGTFRNVTQRQPNPYSGIRVIIYIALYFFCPSVVNSSTFSNSSTDIQFFVCSDTTQLPSIAECSAEVQETSTSASGLSRVYRRASVTMDQPSHATLWVKPFFVNQINVYVFSGGQWQLSTQGGANTGKSIDTMRLGGHSIFLDVSQGQTDFLIELVANNPLPYVHLSFVLGTHTTNLDSISVAMHLGMLWLLVVLVLLGLILRPEDLQRRLLVVVLLSALSVSIGSGAVYAIWPTAPVDLVGSTTFHIVNVLRLLAMVWVYQAIVGPGNRHSSFKYTSRMVYGLSPTAVIFFLLGAYDFGLLLTSFIFVLAIATPLVGVYGAGQLSGQVRRALLIVGGLYLSVALGLIFSTLTPTQYSLPIYLTRVFDLLLPLGLLATVVIRNRVADDDYAAAQTTLAAQATMLQNERQAREEKRLLIDMLTHEIKNPLASINFALSNLRQSIPFEAEDSSRRFQNIARSVYTIDQIIERCNLANGIENERVTPNIEPVSLDALFRDLISTSFERDRIDMVHSKSCEVLTDPYLLRVVAANLIDNALKYAKPSTRIELSLIGPKEHKHLNHRWGFSVQNTIDAQMAPDTTQVFDRYYRHPLAQRSRGSGLGLSLSKQIVQMLNGHLTCHYQPSADDVGIICFEVIFYAN